MTRRSASLAELRQMLASIARIKRDAPVILDPASDVPLGDVIDVFDLVARGRVSEGAVRGVGGFVEGSG